MATAVQGSKGKNWPHYVFDTCNIYIIKLVHRKLPNGLYIGHWVIFYIYRVKGTCQLDEQLAIKFLFIALIN